MILAGTCRAAAGIVRSTWRRLGAGALCLTLSACTLSRPHYTTPPDVAVGEPAFLRTIEAQTDAELVRGNRAHVLRNGDEIFAGNAYQTGEIGGGVYHSVNGGITWGRIDPKMPRLPSQRIWALAFDAHDQNVLFVGSHSAGIYVVPRTSETLSSSQ